MAEARTGLAIVDWDVTFEVDDKGGPWKPGKPFRSGSLNYLRVPTVGTFARRWAMIDRIAGDDGLWVRGLFDEILRLVGGMNRPAREGGVIRGVDGQPASIEEMAECLGQPLDRMSRATAILTDRRVGLLRTVDSADTAASLSDSGEIPGTPGDSPEVPGNPRPLADDSGTESGTGQGRADQVKTEQGNNRAASPEVPGDGCPISALHVFDSLLTALRAAYGDNPTIRNFAAWLSTRYQHASVQKWHEVKALIEKLIEKSETVELGPDTEPAAYFIGAVKKGVEDGGFGYRPKGTRT
jgi:hypothetical protein